MSKEIIIDGVNVAECKDYDDGTCCNDDVLTLSCEKTICVYKQLKRLQAENEQLKDAIKSINKPVFLPNIEQEATNKYRKALEEIREMFDNCCLKANFLNNCDSDCKYINECNGELSVIQKRISEVLNV